MYITSRSPVRQGFLQHGRETLNLNRPPASAIEMTLQIVYILSMMLGALHVTGPCQRLLLVAGVITLFTARFVQGQDPPSPLDRLTRPNRLDLIGPLHGKLLHESEPLPAHALLRFSTAAAGSGGYVTALAFSPDGNMLAAGVDNNLIFLWDVATGKEIAQLRGHRHRVWTVAFSPDGSLLASGSSDQTIHLWDVATHSPLRVLKGHKGAVRAVAFAPRGRLLASGSEDQSIRIWDAAAGKLLQTLPNQKAVIRTVAFSPDGRQLASGGDDNAIQLWGAPAWKALRQFSGHEDWVRAVGFAPGGRFLASASDDQSIRLWRVSSGKTAGLLRGHRGKVFSLAFSPDGRMLASGSPDFTVRLWEVASGAEVHVFTGHTDWVAAVALSPDGRKLASGSADTTALLWDVAGWSGTASAPPALADGDLEALWKDLMASDVGRADRAVWTLVARARQAVPFLDEHLRPDDRADAQRITELIHDLNDNRFTARRKATQELERLGEPALEALEQTLQSRPPLEVRQRVEQILERLQTTAPSAEQLRLIRSLRVLELVGDAEAQQVLHKLAAGAKAAWLTQEAQASLNRLARRHIAKP
jgi:WD domain, G-beta repeat